MRSPDQTLAAPDATNDLRAKLGLVLVGAKSDACTSVALGHDGPRDDFLSKHARGRPYFKGCVRFVPHVLWNILWLVHALILHGLARAGLSSLAAAFLATGDIVLAGLLVLVPFGPGSAARRVFGRAAEPDRQIDAVGLSDERDPLFAWICIDAVIGDDADHLSDLHALRSEGVNPAHVRDLLGTPGVATAKVRARCKARSVDVEIQTRRMAEANCHARRNGRYTELSVCCVIVHADGDGDHLCCHPSSCEVGGIYLRFSDTRSINEDVPMTIWHTNGRPLVDSILFDGAAAGVSDSDSTAGSFDDLCNCQFGFHGHQSTGFKFQFQGQLNPNRIYFPDLCWEP